VRLKNKDQTVRAEYMRVVTAFQSHSLTPPSSAQFKKYYQRKKRHLKMFGPKDTVLTFLDDVANLSFASVMV